MKYVTLLIIFLLPLPSLASCQNYKKLHGIIYLKNKSWATTHVDKTSVRLCEPLLLPSSPNLKITVKNGTETFSTKIFRPLVGHWDHITADKKLTGGTYELEQLTIESFVPEWFKGATLVVHEIPSNKLIIESKL